MLVKQSVDNEAHSGKEEQTDPGHDRHLVIHLRSLRVQSP